MLITTRFTNLRFLRGHRPLNLPLFTEEQSFELFREVIGKEEVEKHEAEARSLFQRLGYLPIGIAVAASLVREDVRYTIAGLAKKLPADAYALLREAVVALSPSSNANGRHGSVRPGRFPPRPCGGGSRTRRGIVARCVAGNTLALAGGRVGSNQAAISAARAGARGSRCIRCLQRRKHAECVREEFEDWENGWRQCEEDMADWQVAFSWLLGQASDDETWGLARASWRSMAYLVHLAAGAATGSL